MPRIFPEYDPIAIPREISVEVNPPVYGESPVFDFDAGEFKFTPTGALLKVSEREALGEWVRKTLITPRFAHGIYPNWYGSDLLHEIGGGDPHPKRSSLSVIGDIESNIKDALLVNRRITNVTDFASVFHEDHFITTFTVHTTLGPIPNLTFELEMPDA